MRTQTRTRDAGPDPLSGAPAAVPAAVPVDPDRDPVRAAALDRLSTVLGARTPAPTQATAPVDRPPWADPDPDGARPERVPPEQLDTAAWEDPPWWSRVRWAPDKLAGIALVVLVVALGGFSVHRLLSSVPEAHGVPELPLADPDDPVPADGTRVPEPGAGPETTPVGATAGVEAGEEEVVVSVVGLVARSGLVTLAPGARVSDALDAAGGVLEGGDRDGLNLARRVGDGEQILVGLAPGPEGPRGPRSNIVGPEAGSAVTDPAQPAGPAPDAPAPGGGPALVDLNTADAAALESLPGVGPVTASSILAWRTANGSFSRVDQLAEVDGIGPATLARLRPLVTV